ncbi:hypothetical protein MIR68_008615 [Amoeboaphelidium protococcarum]|nr:hypothetical protein MIR68_008615 [Amoeboaphelidium protococcarum]KAI3644201.1 hypothetical protein MP228_010365 [Amoeboaphelidium protococcarum]
MQRFFRPQSLQLSCISLKSQGKYLSSVNSKSVNDEEVSKFSALSKQWWNHNGPFRMLHLMNPCRVRYILDAVKYKRNQQNLKGLKVLDIGCGGGILSMALARLGASVTGIDASESNIVEAKRYSSLTEAVLVESGSLQFKHITAEQLLQEGGGQQQFDVVCTLELLEHVDDPQDLISTSSQLLKSEGILFASTINKTALSQLLTITMAEDILQLVPQGTHDYNKFIPPQDMIRWMEDAHIAGIDDEFGLRGMIYNPLKSEWALTAGSSTMETQCNYIMCGIKK